MDSSKEFLGREPVGKLLFRMALPTVAAQLVNMLYNIVDRIYIGHMPGDGALALTGVGVCMPVILIVSAFAALVGAGGAPRASIYMGKKDYVSAEKTLSQSFTMQIAISIMLTLVLLVFGEDLLYVFGASGNTIGYAMDYLRIYALGTIFVEITLGMNYFITAQGFAKTGMLSVVIGAAANIILDPVFIYGFGMGVEGAALATIISQGLSAAWVLAFLFGRKTFLRIKASYMKLERSIILPSLALGFATFVMQASESVINICFNSSLLRYGGDIAVGAMTILSSVMQFAMLPLQGLGQGAQPVISYNYGAGNRERVKKAYFCLLATSLIYSSLLWLLVQTLPGAFVSMFTSDEALKVFTVPALRLYMGVTILFGAQIACQMTFTALGNARSSTMVAVLRKFILLIPLMYILPHLITGNQTMAVFLAEPIADFLSVAFTVVLFQHEFRKTLRKIGQ